MAERNLIDLWNEYCRKELGGELELFKNTQVVINSYFCGMNPWNILLCIDMEDYNIIHGFFYIKNGLVHSTNMPDSVIDFLELDEYCGRIYDKSYEELCFDPKDFE